MDPLGLLLTSGQFLAIEIQGDINAVPFVLWNRGFGPFSDGEILANATLRCLVSAWVEWTKQKEW